MYLGYLIDKFKIQEREILTI